MEGIPEDQWCYETDARKMSDEKIGAIVNLALPQHALARAASAGRLYSLLDRQPQVTALKEGYLGLSGYRLPTEAEMEYACRAGTVTSRHFGETAELLPEYEWYEKNSQERAWPVGSKKPNGLGLFDMLGNVFNWCQENYKEDYSIRAGVEIAEDKEDSLQIVPTNNRVKHGNSFFSGTWSARSANRHWNVPSYRDVNTGFRPARTVTP
jgi:formylglycine-generating enzyme required for sulfatase activity